MTLEAMAMCRQAGYRRFVSHRSGKPNTFIADLAVGPGNGHLKSGAPARGERVAKRQPSAGDRRRGTGPPLQRALTAGN